MLHIPPTVPTIYKFMELYWQSHEFDQLSKASRDVYRSCLRSFLREYFLCPAIQFDKDALEKAEARMEGVYTQGRIRQMKAAYRRFSEWAIREHRIPFPPMLRKAPGRSQPTTPPPMEVLEAIYGLFKGLPWRELTQRQLLRLRWEDVKTEATLGGSNMVFLLPSKHPGVFLRFPRDSQAGKALLVLQNYAMVEGETLVGPLLPAEPGKDRALSIGALRAGLRQVESAQTTKVEGDNIAIVLGGAIRDEPTVASGTEGAG
tara:strand:- start:106 stop:885 length:780 start_codon:yes stop_codon:yes gene_type:complete